MKVPHKFLKSNRGSLVPSLIPTRRPHHRQLPKQTTALLNKASTQTSTNPADNTIIIPLNYAQILGLRGREFYLDPQITSAYEDLEDFELDAAYSPVARLGKEKLLFAARDGLRTAKGRTSLIHPDIAIEPVLLPGALALLEQAGQYDLVIQLAQQAKSINTKEIRQSNRATMRDYERDVALSTALAHCGLAKRDLEAGRPAMGSAHLEEALYILREESSGSRLSPSSSSALAPQLQKNIVAALADLKADAVLDYLSQPLDLTDTALRRQALEALRSMLMASHHDTKENQRNSTEDARITTQYVIRILSVLTADEICGLIPWDRVVSRASSTSNAAQQYSWWTMELLPKIGLAHIVSGFIGRKPDRVSMALALLRSGAAFLQRQQNEAERQKIDIAIHIAVCEVLLGSPYAALDLLRADEKQGAAYHTQKRARSTFSAAATAASLAFPNRDGVMTFIRAASPDGESDLLPGLCLFVEQWLQRLAFPFMRDTLEQPPLASLAAYFDDPRTEKYLEARETGLNVLSSVKSVVSKAVTLPARLMSVILAYKKMVYAAGALTVMALLTASGFRFVVNNGADAQQKRAALSGRAPGGAAAAAVGVRNKQTASSSSATMSGIVASPSTTKYHLTRDFVHRLVTQWLDIKSEAMGPRHTTSSLSTVLAEPMLSAVMAEAREAASSGWFWNIRPLRTRIISIDESTLTPEGVGYATVVASVDESADLWATNGKKGDSYKTEYKVEYTVVRSSAQSASDWKISSALVLGK